MRPFDHAKARRKKGRREGLAGLNGVALCVVMRIGFFLALVMFVGAIEVLRLAGGMALDVL